MFNAVLAEDLENTDFLEAVFVSTLMDGLLYETWDRGVLEVDLTEVVGHLGQIARAQRALLPLFGQTRSGLLSMENESGRVLLAEVGDDFVAGFVFAPQAPLGLARIHVAYLCAQITEALEEVTREPSGSEAELAVIPSGSRAAQIMAHLEQYAPDPHATRLRLALQTGLGMEALDDLDALSAEQTAMLERAACDILGVEALNL